MFRLNCPFLCAGFFSVLGGPARWLPVGGGGEGRANLRGICTLWRKDASGIYEKQGYIHLSKDTVRYEISSCLVVYLPITYIICGHAADGIYQKQAYV